MKKESFRIGLRRKYKRKSKKINKKGRKINNKMPKPALPNSNKLKTLLVIILPLLTQPNKPQRNQRN